MYIENRDIDIIENKYSSLPICSRLPVYHRVGSNLRRSAFFFHSLSLFPSSSPSLVLFTLCFLSHFFSRLFFNNPPILSLSRIDQNPADRIKSISSACRRVPYLVPLVPISFVFNGENTIDGERSAGREGGVSKRLSFPVSLGSGQGSLRRGCCGLAGESNRRLT